LHATLAAADALGIAVLALHVHHGLSPNADAWLAHCESTCRRWAAAGKPLELASQRLETKPARGDSIEAWARRARYRALRELAVAHGIDLVLLGHHRRDQAETFLLQALRAGGVAALSAMPRLVQRDGVSWARPWLDCPRAAIEAYARRHRLRWIDDDSNDDERFARNRLRHQVWPALTAAFPDAEAALADAARWAQQAMAALGEIAATDAATVTSDTSLDLVAWHALAPARRRQALREWLAQRTGTPAPSSLVERLLREADAEGTRRWPSANGELLSYRGRLTWAPRSLAVVDVQPLTIDLSRPGLHEVEAWRGAFRVERVVSGGLASARAAHLELRARKPGDRFQAGAGRPPRSLKLQYQAAGIPAPARVGPIVCSADVPVFVPELGIDARARAAAGEPQVGLVWLPR
jgi:tRNA(Ile)-lysidine synthase